MNVIDQPGYTKPEAQRGLGLQFLIAFVFGCTSVISFSFCRRRLPQIYAACALRKPGLPPLRTTFLGWISDVIRIKDRDILRFAGLDAYVYLMFFRAAISLLWKLSLVSLFFIAPLHWYYLGQLDDDKLDGRISADDKVKKGPNFFGDYMWVYVASTYIFTVICLRTVREYTNEVVSVRQAYLGHQNTITDRTLRISGIARKLRSEASLKSYFTTLLGAEPESIVLCRRWEKLDLLFEKRKKIILELELLWTRYIGADNAVFSENDSAGFAATVPPLQSTPAAYSDYSDEQGSEMYGEGRADTAQSDARSSGSASPPHSDSTSEVDPSSVWHSTEGGGINAIAARMFPDRKRPTGCVGLWGLRGPRVDLIDYYGRKLAGIDMQIEEKRLHADDRKATNIAFVTMKTVVQCQVAAQAIMSPKPHAMVNYLAPAPNDIIWRNIYLRPKQRSLGNYIISLIVLVTNVFLIFPLTYLARFLDINTIRKHFPSLGSWLADRKWMAAFVTDVLPTYVFSSFNLVVPYFFAWLSKHQGFISKSDVELSTIGKNFFYVFINLFLIFTIESTFFSFSVDQMARDFAHWLIRLSSFYTNLIILQGLGITPFKLLQPGSIFQFPFLANRCQTARDYHDLYKPQKINYGLVLPIPMFIFVVALTYSILRRRILLFGLIYFAASYFVFKYQLMYTMVHPQHSNAQLWTIITRRFYLAIGVFHLAMIGVLVLQSAYRLAMLILPLSVLLLGFCYDFERFSKPLLEFVAIEALQQREIDAHNLGTYQPDPSEAASEVSDSETSSFARPEESSSSRGGTTRSRHHSSALLDRAEAITSLNLNGSDSADLSNRLWASGDNHDRTLDEDREQGLWYANKNLVDPLDGPWVATTAFDCIVANPDGFHRRPISHADWL